VKRATATVCACCLAALAQTAAAAPITLVSPNTPGPAPPPLAGGPQLSSEPGEVRVPGSLANVEAVRVGIAQDGTPVSVVVVQRISIRGLGDFRFIVPAPAVAADAAAGSQSLPGLRQAGIVWQGFSPGRRLLAARVTLRLGTAAAGLPLGVSVERRNGFTRVRLENRSARQFAVSRGSAPLPALQAVLARTRRELGREFAAGRPLPIVFEQVEGRPRAAKIVAIDAPLRVTGTIAGGGRTARVDTTLGGGQPPSRVVAMHGEGRVTIALDAAFERDRRKLLPTAGELASSSDPLLALQTALARTAVTLQFQQYLASPKPGGASTTTYRYETARRTAAAPAQSGGDAGPSALLLALIAIGALAALGALTVLWAHL
jgi:hypothetical protein